MSCEICKSPTQKDSSTCVDHQDGGLCDTCNSLVFAGLVHTAEERAEMLALLKEHQWAGLETGPFGVDSWDICPECGERKSDGHSEYCEWAALLRRNHEPS